MIRGGIKFVKATEPDAPIKPQFGQYEAKPDTVVEASNDLEAVLNTVFRETSKDQTFMKTGLVSAFKRDGKTFFRIKQPYGAMALAKLNGINKGLLTIAKVGDVMKVVPKREQKEAEVRFRQEYIPEGAKFVKIATPGKAEKVSQRPPREPLTGAGTVGQEDEGMPMKPKSEKVTSMLEVVKKADVDPEELAKAQAYFERAGLTSEGKVKRAKDPYLQSNLRFVTSDVIYQNLPVQYLTNVIPQETDMTAVRAYMALAGQGAKRGVPAQTGEVMSIERERELMSFAPKTEYKEGFVRVGGSPLEALRVAGIVSVPVAPLSSLPLAESVMAIPESIPESAPESVPASRDSGTRKLQRRGIFLEAMKIYRKNNPKAKIPRKGTSEYAEVMKIMSEL
jgi:hypothetical protein